MLAPLNSIEYRENELKQVLMNSWKGRDTKVAFHLKKDYSRENLEKKRRKE